MNCLKFSPILLFLLILLTACNNNIKFEKAGWNQQGDLGVYLNRDKMLDDLIENYEIIGLSHEQIINLIGKPDGHEKSDSVFFYNIIVDYTYNIDPTKIKTLQIEFGKGNLVKQFIINETKH